MPSCVLYTQDEELMIRITRIAATVAMIHPISSPHDLEQRFLQFGDTVLLADLRAPECFDLLAEMKSRHPLSVIIALGSDRSDPMLEAEWLEPFSTADLNIERRNLQALLAQAIECQQLRQKVNMLETALADASAGQRHQELRLAPRSLFSAPLQHFSKAQQNFDNLGVLFDSVVEGLVATAKVSRAGIFTKKREGDNYLFRAGMRCLRSTEALSISESHPFINWLEMNTHLISRQTLENVRHPDERMMLKRMLNSFGAEIIIPLYASGHIKGWIFVGQRATGIPFEYCDLEALTGLSDHISTTLEKAMKYEETALQKVLAETLLHSIPFGIVACDEAGEVRWLNSTAQQILHINTESAVGQRIEILGSRIAHVLHHTLDDQEFRENYEWTDTASKHTFSTQSRRLMNDTNCVGAMLMIRDITSSKLLEEKEQQLERANFWNELAAGMSHEIRNPLVAINTFAQMLPKHYEDPEFRNNFSQQVIEEVKQLNRIIEKINEFAYPAKPEFERLDIHKPIQQAISRSEKELGHDNLHIYLKDDHTPAFINGATDSMTECFYHLLLNAAENLKNRPGSNIYVYIKTRSPKDGTPHVAITIADNGTGIDAQLRDKIFSPFITEKARGLGLGLPIVKRTIIDHNGQLNVETSPGGTSVTITLPLCQGKYAATP